MSPLKTFLIDTPLFPPFDALLRDVRISAGKAAA
jgi:hypothetical protein